MTIRKNNIDFKNVEKLVHAETQRRKILLRKKSNKLLVLLVAFLLVTTLFLQ